MTDLQAEEQTTADPAAVRQGDGVVRTLLGPTLVVLAVLGVAAGLSAIGFAALLMYIGAALVAIAIPYTVAAVLTTVILHARVAPRAPQTEDDHEVQRFGRFCQRSSLVLAVVLLAVLVASGILNVVGSFDVASLAVSGAVIVGAVFTIAVNLPQLYSPNTIALEKHAVATRTGAWRLILVSWIVSPLMWIAYAATVAVLVLPSVVR